MKDYIRDSKASVSGNSVIIIAAILCMTVIIIAFMTTVVIDPGHEGVIFDKSEGVLVNRPLTEGLSFVKPYWQTVTEIEVRTKKKEVPAGAASKDLQIVTSIVALNYHPTKGETPLLYKEIGLQYEDRVISPAVQECVKAVTAKYTAEELITKREFVSSEIKHMLTNRLKEAHITVDYFSIVDFEFSSKFTEAIEAKQEAEQLALKAENDLRRIEIEKKQVIAKAEGEARAIEIKAEALRQNPNLVDLEAVYKWDGRMPWLLVMGGENVPAMLINTPMPVSNE